MMLKRCGRLAGIFLLVSVAGGFAQEIDKDKINQAMEAFKSGEGKDKINDLIGGFKKKPPKGLPSVGPVDIDIPVTAKPLDEADKQYCEVHLKNAKRNYRQKNYDRAMDAIKNVLSVDPNHGEAFFMRSVIGAKRKEYLQAWKDVDRAKSILGESDKMTDYINRLQKVSPRPDSFAGLSVGNRPIPTHVSEYAMDIIEVFFTDKDAATNVSGLSWPEIAEAGGKSSITFVFRGKAKLNVEAIKSRFKELSGAEVENPKEEAEGKSFSLTISVPQIGKNPSPKAVEKTLDFLDTLSKECDVKVETETENPDEAAKALQGTYVIMAEGLGDLNNFLRKASQRSQKYWVENLEYTLEGARAVWKAKAAIRFQMP
jgi:tetratricopeptide (TPR) repeat protein